jgi:hypothetical protein
MSERHRLARTGPGDNEQRAGTETTFLAALAKFGGESLGRVQHPQIIEFLLCCLHGTPRK